MSNLLLPVYSLKNTTTIVGSPESGFMTQPTASAASKTSVTASISSCFPPTPLHNVHIHAHAHALAMTRIDGIIILDTNGYVVYIHARLSGSRARRSHRSKPIIASNFPSHPPSYSAIHIDAFNHALKLSRSRSALNSNSNSHSGAGAGLPGGQNDVEPVIWVNTLSRTAGESVGMGVGMGGAGLCHLEREGLRFLVPISHEGEWGDPSGGNGKGLGGQGGGRDAGGMEDALLRPTRCRRRRRRK